MEYCKFKREAAVSQAVSLSQTQFGLYSSTIQMFHLKNKEKDLLCSP